MSVNSSRKLSRAIHSQKLFNFTSHIFIYFSFLHFLANKFTFSALILRYRYRSHGQSNCALLYHRQHPIGLPAKALYVKAYSDLFCKGICYRFIVLLRFFFFSGIWDSSKRNTLHPTAALRPTMDFGMEKKTTGTTPHRKTYGGQISEIT